MCEDYYEYYHQNLGNAESDFQPTDEAPPDVDVCQRTNTMESRYYFGASWGSVPDHVVEALSPLLLGMDIMRYLDLNINFSTGIAHSGRLKQGILSSDHWIGPLDHRSV